MISATVTDADGVTGVCLIIHPPDNSIAAASGSTPVMELPSADLLPVGDDRYETTFGDFNASGTYHITIFARDAKGNISLPARTKISVSQQQKHRISFQAPPYPRRLPIRPSRQVRRYFFPDRL